MLYHHGYVYIYTYRCPILKPKTKTLGNPAAAGCRGDRISEVPFAKADHETHCFPVDLWLFPVRCLGIYREHIKIIGNIC